MIMNWKYYTYEYSKSSPELERIRKSWVCLRQEGISQFGDITGLVCKCVRLRLFDNNVSIL